MDVESLAKQLILKGMTEEQQKAVLDSIKATMSQAREVQKQRIGANVQVVVQALKKMEADIRSRYDEVGNKIEKRVATIKDGQDGRNGVNGKDGKDGRPGRDGGMGPRGADGLNGRDGRDGDDGVSVTDAHIDFDGSLVISLSSGRTINVGEVVAPDLAEKIKVITNGGGTSQQVLDTLASLQTQIDNLIPSQTGNAGKFLTTDGTDLAWADVAGGLDYQGTWNAATNTPTLASGVGTNGYYYVVSVDGSTNLDGTTDWKAGDWLIFNGATWQKIDQSWAIAGANNNITSMTGITGGISSPDFIQFDTTATVTDATGKLYYDNADQFQTLAFQMNGARVQHVGEELYYRVKLSASATKGQVLMFTGTLGASGGLTAAPATGLTPDQSNYILGVATESGTTNAWITVVEFGEVKNINTTGGAESWAQGDVLYYNPLVTGGLTKTKPTTPAAIALVAAVVNVGTSNGILFVRPTFGSVLGGTDGNVNFTSLASGNTLIYDASVGVWKNANLTDGTGISITEGAGSITVTNTAPDQTVVLTGSGTTTVTGTYPNFTIASDDQYDGTVTSVGGTGTVNGISLSGTVTSSGNLTLGGTLSGVSLTTQVSGTLPIANGGTGQTTRQNAMDALAGAVTSGQYLRGNGTDVVMSAIQAADVPTLNQNTTGTAANVTGTVAIANGGTGATTAATALTNLGAYAATNPNGYITTPFPVGTVMLFAQTAAPTGWTKLTTHDNKALRVVSGTASSGGTVAFTTAFSSSRATSTVSISASIDGTTLTTAQMPSHRHSIREEFGVAGNGAYSPNDTYSQIAGNNAGTKEWVADPISFEGGSGSHNHGFSQSGHFHATDLAVQYVDVIIATKD